MSALAFLAKGYKMQGFFCAMSLVAVLGTATSASVSASVLAQTETLILPSEAESIDAIVELFSRTRLNRPTALKLGTCIPARFFRHEGQIACTIAVTVDGKISETVADFWPEDGAWKAGPTSSADESPRPDPKLQ